MKRTRNGVERSEIVCWLEETFKVSTTTDVSYNGLQFEGREEITKIATGVDANVDFVQKAAAADADFALVHHGVFWKGSEWKRIDKFAAHLVANLTASNLNLYALHLPLDMHPKLGNNALIASALGAKVVEPFSEFLNQKVGVTAKFDKSMKIESLKRLIESRIGPVLHHLPFGPKTVSRIGIVSGSGWNAVLDPLAANGEIDAIITGEVAHQAVALCREREIHIFAAGHYATETFGVKAVGESLAAEFGIEHVFIDMPSGL